MKSLGTAIYIFVFPFQVWRGSLEYHVEQSFFWRDAGVKSHDVRSDSPALDLKKHNRKYETTAWHPKPKDPFDQVAICGRKNASLFGFIAWFFTEKHFYHGLCCPPTGTSHWKCDQFFHRNIGGICSLGSKDETADALKVRGRFLFFGEGSDHQVTFLSHDEIGFNAGSSLQDFHPSISESFLFLYACWGFH